jgi:hypothetical protein
MLPITSTHDLPHLRRACYPLHQPTIYHTWGKHVTHYTNPRSTTLEVSMLPITPTHDLPHLRRACYPLHYWCSCTILAIVLCRISTANYFVVHVHMIFAYIYKIYSGWPGYNRMNFHNDLCCKECDVNC